MSWHVKIEGVNGRHVYCAGSPFWDPTGQSMGLPVRCNDHPPPPPLPFAWPGRIGLARADEGPRGPRGCVPPEYWRETISELADRVAAGELAVFPYDESQERFERETRENRGDPSRRDYQDGRASSSGGYQSNEFERAWWWWREHNYYRPDTETTYAAVHARALKAWGDPSWHGLPGANAVEQAIGVIGSVAWDVDAQREVPARAHIRRKLAELEAERRRASKILGGGPAAGAFKPGPFVDPASVGLGFGGLPSAGQPAGGIVAGDDPLRILIAGAESVPKPVLWFLVGLVAVAIALLAKGAR